MASPTKVDLAVAGLPSLLIGTGAVAVLGVAGVWLSRRLRHVARRQRLVAVEDRSAPAFPADLPPGVVATVSSVALVDDQLRILRRRGLHPHGLLIHQALVGSLVAPELGAFTLWCRTAGLTLRVSQAVPESVLTWELSDGDWQLAWPLVALPLTPGEGHLVHLRECSAGDILRARAPDVWAALGGHALLGDPPQPSCAPKAF